MEIKTTRNADKKTTTKKYKDSDNAFPISDFFSSFFYSKLDVVVKRILSKFRLFLSRGRSAEKYWDLRVAGSGLQLIEWCQTVSFGVRRGYVLSGNTRAPWGKGSRWWCQAVTCAFGWSASFVARVGGCVVCVVVWLGFVVRSIRIFVNVYGFWLFHEGKVSFRMVSNQCQNGVAYMKTADFRAELLGNN